MEITVTKTGKPGYEFQYIDYIDFGDHNLAPVSSGFDETYCSTECEVDYDDETECGQEYTPVSEILSQHITAVQLCGPDGEEINPEGDELYDYIERKIEIAGDDGQTYYYVDSEDGPIVTTPCMEQERSACDPETDYEEFIGQLIDTFEDFLDENGYTIRNDEEHSDAAELVGGEHGSAEDSCGALVHIYGSDYDALADVYRNITPSWEDSAPDPVSRSTAAGYVDEMIAVFTGIMTERGISQDDIHEEDAPAVSEETLSDLMHNWGLEGNLLDTFERWGLCSIDVYALDEACEDNPEL